MSLKMAKFMKKLYEVSQKEESDIIEQLFGKPLFNATNIAKYEEGLKKLAKLNRPPFPSQVEQGILPLKESLEKYKAGILLGEMGVGKTQISFSLIEVLKLKQRKVLFLTAGSKHLRKMKREAEEILGEKAIVYTIVNNNPKRRKKEVLPEEAATMKAPTGRYLIFLMSKDTAKFNLKEDSIINWGEKCPFCGSEVWPASWNTTKIRKAKRQGIRPNYKISHCSECGINLQKKVAKNLIEGNLIFPNRIRKNKKYKNQRRISIGERLKRMTKAKTDKVFDYLIIDEAHEMQNPFSLQSKVYRELVRVSHKTLIMTGTLTNGYTSSLYYILYPILSWFFKEKGYNFYDVETFVEHYGEKKQTKNISTIDKGKNSIKVQELPRISDRIISFLASFTAWIKIKDLNIKMPSYKEEAYVANMNWKIEEALNWYVNTVIEYIRRVNINYISNFALRVMYIQNNPFMRGEFEIISSFDNAYPIYLDNWGKLRELKKVSFIQVEEIHSRTITEIDKKNGNVFQEKIKKIKLNVAYPGINKIIEEKKRIEKEEKEKKKKQQEGQETVDIEETIDIEMENISIEDNDNKIIEIPEETILSKEQSLINEIKKDLQKGRNVLIYSVYNKVAQIDKRIYKVLLQEEIVDENEIAILPENLKSENIEQWIEEHPVKILIASPIKLATGLDLTQFPAIKFYETGTNLRVIQQASRRSWRAVGQKYPVVVQFFAYNGIQSDLLALVGKKLRAAATVDGRKVDNSQLSHVFDENKALTVVLNKIAEEVESSSTNKANFTNIYEQGKLRPLTKMEARFKELIEENKNNELFEKLTVDKSKKTRKSKEAFEVPLNDNLFDFVNEEDSEIEEIFEIKIKKEGNQYVFDF